MSDNKKDICENMHIMDYGDIEDTLYNAGIGIYRFSNVDPVSDYFTDQ